MKCTYCGAELPAGKSFCMWCGTRQTEEASVPMPKKIEFPVMDPVEEAFPEIYPMMEAPVSVALHAPENMPEKVPEKMPEPVDQSYRAKPSLQLPAQRGLGKMFFLGILTLGIYPTVIWSRIVTELNIAASRYDGKRTMSYFGMLMLAPITLGIYPLVWMHKFCKRIGAESARRNTGANFGPSDFWLWGVLGSLIIVGPFIFVHKLMKAMNMLNTNYNVYG